MHTCLSPFKQLTHFKTERKAVCGNGGSGVRVGLRVAELDVSNEAEDGGQFLGKRSER